MAFQRAPRALPTSPRDSPGVSLSTTDRVSCEKIMYEERGLLGAFGSFLAFLVFLPAAPAASLPFFAAGAFLTFFLGRCSASLSLPPPSLSLPDSALAFFAFVPAAAFLAAAGAFFFFAPLLAPLSLPPPSLSPSLPSLSDASEGSPPSSSSLPAAYSSSSSDDSAPPSSSSSARARDFFPGAGSSSSSSSIRRSARALPSPTLDILSCLAFRKLTKFWNSDLGMLWKVCDTSLFMVITTSKVRCMDAAPPPPACRSNSTVSTSAYCNSSEGLGR
mmetsp:Transcript_30655/g.76789  ORF Transcript_30655/g.76789 Transcript_30655/m.76789 type:complete len:275 (-) Transcript_30655:1437-2261(-)